MDAPKSDKLLEKNANGKLAVTRAILRPKVTVSDEKQPSEQQVEKMHDQSHEQCLIASSVKTCATVEASSPLSLASARPPVMPHAFLVPGWPQLNLTYMIIYVKINAK